MIDKHEYQKYLPMTIYYFIIPTIGVQLILHTMLYMGIFETNINLTICEYMCESLHYTQLIVPSDDKENLQEDSKNILSFFGDRQVIYLPNYIILTESWIM